MPDAITDPHVDQQAIRTLVYESLLARLSLSPEHRQSLRSRGLSDEEIDRRGYRTHAVGKAFTTEPEYLDYFRATPGFLIDGHGRISLKAGNCIVLPCRCNTGAIVALKCRRDHTPAGREKYHWLSSRDDEHPAAPSPGAPVHVPLGIIGPIATVRLTEGELKSDVATCLNCTPTIGVSGVATWQHAIPVLRELEVKRVKLAFDSDVRRNRGVAQHLLNCARLLLSQGFVIEWETWPDAYKGIDDLLAAGQAPEVLTGDAAIQAIRENARGLGVDVTDPQPVARRGSAATRRSTPASPSHAQDSDFLSAKAAVDLAALLTRHLGKSRGRKWHCPFHEGKGFTLSIFRDRLGIARYRCFHPDCDSSGDAIDFLTRHCGRSFGQACEELGLPIPAKAKSVAAPKEQPAQEAVEARKHAEVHAWLLQDCRYRGRCVVLVRRDNPNQLFNVFPPCGSRYKCPYCRRESTPLTVLKK